MGRLSRISGQLHNPVNMIRYHHKLVQANVGSHNRGSPPFFLYDQSYREQNHRSVNNFSQHTLSIMSANGDKIPTRPRIIPPGKRNGLTPISMVQGCPSRFRDTSIIVDVPPGRPLGSNGLVTCWLRVVGWRRYRLWHRHRYRLASCHPRETPHRGVSTGKRPKGKGIQD